MAAGIFTLDLVVTGDGHRFVTVWPRIFAPRPRESLIRDMHDVTPRIEAIIERYPHLHEPPKVREAFLRIGFDLLRMHAD
jgi:hypothetical protein